MLKLSLKLPPPPCAVPTGIMDSFCWCVKVASTMFCVFALNHIIQIHRRMLLCTSSFIAFFSHISWLLINDLGSRCQGSDRFRGMSVQGRELDSLPLMLVVFVCILAALLGCLGCSYCSSLNGCFLFSPGEYHL